MRHSSANHRKNRANIDIDLTSINHAPRYVLRQVDGSPSSFGHDVVNFDNAPLHLAVKTSGLQGVFLSASVS